MAVSKSFLARALELLEPLGKVAARAMFGGHGLYLDGVMFGLLDDDELYLRTDAQNVERFKAAGCRPWVYPSPKGPMVTQYYRPPDDAFEDPEAMLPWARLGLEAARAKAAAKKAKPAKSPRAKKAVSAKAAPSPRKRR